MSIDLTGGLADDLEFVFASKPDDPEMRESVNAWIWDDGTDFGLPRIGIEAISETWDAHGIQLNVSFADGRVYRLYGAGASLAPVGADGKARVLGAGPLSFELVEPFGLLRMHFDGDARAMHVDEQIRGDLSSAGQKAHLQIEVELRPAAPPWTNGALIPEAKHVLDTQEEGYLMGHPWRFEQLCRATGVLKVDGVEHPINGGANRIRRQSIRRTAALRGHAWQAALFPSGSGFGYIVYPPRTDGLPTYNEGYVFDGDGPLVGATVVEAPWLRSLAHRGQDVSVVLQTVDGRRIEIGGESVASTFMVMPPDAGGLQLQQAIARYRWDGESANGMMERSSALGLISA